MNENKKSDKKFSMETEVADSIWKQIKGMSFSKKKNMLFLMPLKRKWEFWMFGMLYPIKIIFIDDDKKIFDIQDAGPLTLNPKTWKIYRPKKMCRYILEESGKHKFEVNDKLEW